jgi:hypothetical protein
MMEWKEFGRSSFGLIEVLPQYLSAPHTHFFKNYFNIILQSSFLSPKWYLPFRFSNKILYAVLISQILLNLITLILITFGEEQKLQRQT